MARGHTIAKLTTAIIATSRLIMTEVFISRPFLQFRRASAPNGGQSASPSRAAPRLSRPRVGEDTEQERVRLGLAGGHDSIDTLAGEALLPGRRPLLAVEIPVEINEEPVAALPRERQKLLAGEGVELDGLWCEAQLSPRRSGDEDDRESVPECFRHGFLHTFFQVASGLKILIARAIAALFGPRSFLSTTPS